MKKTLIIIISIFFAGCVQINSQKTKVTEDIIENKKEEKVDSLSLLFLGDIMGHDTQIRAAYDSVSSSYNYHSVFKKISPLLKSTDFTVGNLEVTLAGEPYKGYPRFSSPDALAIACKSNGVNVLVTSNNHSKDRKKAGVIRTLDILDSLNIYHTGTFRDSLERVNTNLLVLTKNSIRIGILNYTYGSNIKSSIFPAIVNKIDTALMLQDISKSKKDSLDKLIVVLHWGKEYKSLPNEFQKSIANFLFLNGVDVIIGSHPHVIQPMAYLAKTDSSKERFIAYSLGNFVSNQRKRATDGGALASLQLIKKDGDTTIGNAGYYLTWVYKHEAAGEPNFEVLLAESNELNQLNKADSSAMTLFMIDSRKLMEEENLKVSELKFPFKSQ